MGNAVKGYSVFDDIGLWYSGFEYIESLQSVVLSLSNWCGSAGSYFSIFGVVGQAVPVDSG
jgi:hypothetical protein